jgi:hypothetical protein
LPNLEGSFANWLRFRNGKIVGAFFISLFVSLLFLGFAVHYITLPRTYQPIDNEIWTKYFSLNPKANPTNESETQHSSALFEIPLSYNNWALPMNVSLTLTNNYFFVEDTLTSINASIYTTGNSTLTNAINIELFRIDVSNAVQAYPESFTLNGYSSGYSFDYFSPKTIYFSPKNSEQHTAFNQTWCSSPEPQSNYALFRVAGNVTITIIIDMHPSSEMYDTIMSYLKETKQSYPYHYNVTITLPDIHIRSESELTNEQKTQQLQAIQLQEMNMQSQMQAIQAVTTIQAQEQQNDTNNSNMGLTFVVLFLTAVQITIALYDHSYDQRREAKDNEEKVKNKQFDDFSIV